MLDAAAIRSLPTPGTSECAAFTEHLATVHSWYKHLSLINGGEFIVFLAPDAGDNYPAQHPLLPTENTPDGYRRAFGHLDYVYRADPNAQFERDGAAAPKLASDIASMGKLTLYPYVSHEMYWSAHENDVTLIRNGTSHPDAAAVIAAYDSYQCMTQCWNELSDYERELITNIDEGDLSIGLQLSESGRQYQALETKVRDTYRKLQESEMMKIRRCVDDLRQWMA